MRIGDEWELAGKIKGGCEGLGWTGLGTENDLQVGKSGDVM